MIISLVFAIDLNGVIGLKGELPWHLPDDLRHFKAITLGKPIIMGRKTHESIGRPLPGRLNIVLSRNGSYMAPGCDVVQSIQEALTAASESDEIMVIGGSRIFEHFLPLADRMYVTLIDAAFEGDVYFPEIEWNAWREVSRETIEKNETRPFDYHHVVYERLNGSARDDKGSN